MTIPTTTPGTLGRARTPIAAIVRRLAVISALAVTVFGVSAATASAGEGEQIHTKGGYVWFSDKGEYLGALDRRRDGFAVRAYVTWHLDGGGQVSVMAPSKASGAIAVKLRIPEGNPVTLRMCYTKASSDVKCSDPQRAFA